MHNSYPLISQTSLIQTARNIQFQIIAKKFKFLISPKTNTKELKINFYATFFDRILNIFRKPY